MRVEFSERAGIQVIARAAAVLRALQVRPDGLTLGELANDVGLPRSTVQRLVDALDAEGLVLAASKSSGVRLGPGLLALAAATRFHLAETASETLRQLSVELGETIDLSLLDQDKAVFIDQIPGRHRLAAVSSIGVSFSLHSSANGKAMLAMMSTAELDRLRRKKLVARTANTITNWNLLDQELEAIRSSGVAFDNEENCTGISAIGVALRSPSGELGAISIPAPTQRFEATKEKLIRVLLKRVARLQRQLAQAG